MKQLEFLIIHCTATKEGVEVTSDTIRKWHLSPVSEGGRGWKQVGYSDMIHLDGSIENLVSYNEDNNVDPWEITNGVAGYNGKSRHIVYVGGLDKYLKAKDTRTNKQFDAMKDYVLNFISLHPNCKVAGHNDFDNKACPCFSVKTWCKNIGLQPENIYE
jgi:hypothetical protein